MARFLALRFGGALLTLLLAVTIAILLTRVAGDPVVNILGLGAPQSQIDALRAELGFDDPLPVQWWDHIRGLVRGDLGVSLQTQQPNVDVIGPRLLASLSLAVSAFMLAVIIGVPLGLMAAWHQDSAVDRLLSALAVIGQSVPTFWVGLMAILVFAVQLQWLPSGGYGSLSQLVLPAVVLSLHPMAFMARITRGASVEMMSEPFMMAATVRGVPQSKVIFRHLLRNVTVPLLSVAGLQVAGLLSGVVTIELVFGWPGMGTLAVQAVQFKDFPLVEAIVVVSALVFVVSNLVVDILYGIVDPRVRTKH